MYSYRVQLSYLHIFYAVGRHGGFSRASRELSIQQPSISRAVKLLEEELGQKLLVRKKTHAELTTAGKELFQLCERIFEDITMTERKLQSEMKGVQGVMSFGISDHILNRPLVPLLKGFLKENPNVIPRAYTGTSEEICQRLLNNELDFALLVTVPPLSGLTVKAIASFTARLYIATEYQKDEKVKEFFIGSREIDYSANRSFPTVEALQKVRPQTRVGLSTNSLEAHRQMMLQGLGIALIPDFMMKEDLKEKRAVVLDSKYVYQTKLWWVAKKGKSLSNAVTLFEKNLRDDLKAHLFSF